MVQGRDLPTASARLAHVIPFFMRLNTMVSVTSFRVRGASALNDRVAALAVVADRRGAAAARRSASPPEPRIATRADAGAAVDEMVKADMIALWGGVGGGWVEVCVRCEVARPSEASVEVSF